MNIFAFRFQEQELHALPSGALFWPTEGVLIVSDLHFGKAARQARYGGAALPPYESRDTLQRLDDDITRTGPRHVVCLGDSFDAPEVDQHLPTSDLEWLTRLQAGLTWTWIEGNHDPGPLSLGGSHRSHLSLGPLHLQHIATSATGEISGHYHPKIRLHLRGRSLSRPCFLWDEDRLILPAYGTYTGGLDCQSPVLRRIMRPDARAILTGATPCSVPMTGLPR